MYNLNDLTKVELNAKASTGVPLPVLDSSALKSLDMQLTVDLYFWTSKKYVTEINDMYQRGSHV